MRHHPQTQIQKQSLLFATVFCTNEKNKKTGEMIFINNSKLQQQERRIFRHSVKFLVTASLQLLEEASSLCCWANRCYENVEHLITDFTDPRFLGKPFVTHYGQYSKRYHHQAQNEISSPNDHNTVSSTAGESSA